MSKKDEHGQPINNQFSEALASVPVKIRDYLCELAEKDLTEEEFISAFMVGDCPHCGSSRTIDGEEPPINNILVGICMECGTFWCLECGNGIDKSKIRCECWNNLPDPELDDFE